MYAPNPQTAPQTGPFRLHGLLPGTGQPWLDKFAVRGIERLLGLSTLDAAYRELGASRDCDEFIAKACAALDVELRFPAEELAHIPLSGPVVVVANHPFGGIEGMLLAGLLRRRRKDVRVMANHLLQRIPELSELFIGVDPFNGPQAGNAAGLRRAVRWLRDGGVLLVFPAGAVSHWQLSRGSVTDPVWNPGIGRLIHLARASVVPVYIYGNNGPAFHVAGLLHPRLRTALLARELLNKASSRIALRIGRPLEYPAIGNLAAEPLIRFLRLRTYLLGAVGEELAVPRGPQPTVDPAPANADRCGREVALLRTDQRLAATGELAVYLAHAAQIPHLLREIGRQRELAFRAVGEGTGQESDLDEFDADYLHLFVWNEERHELVGGYRLGLTDHILARRGLKGLYTRCLFRLKKRLFDRMGPALELGRSFVRTDYQRGFAPLLLLWKGIGTFVARNPHYRVLFGPVSISNEYNPLSRQLIMDYLRSSLFDAQLARMVKPRNSPARRRGLWQPADLAMLGDIEPVSALLAGIEPDGKGVPVLLRQYLKLGGRILGFNVDPAFSHAIDALIMVDLTRCDVRTLRRYMGRQEAAGYLAHHGRPARAA